MHLKKPCVGLGMALVVSPAGAADPIIPVPENAGYVRVCDAAGTGYFYIPGTENCLRSGGYVRYDMGFGFRERVRSASGRYTWNKRARFALDLDSWIDTEMGDLTTAIRLYFNWATEAVDPPPGYTTSNAVDIYHAYIDLSGLRMGNAYSFFTDFADSAGDVNSDDLAGGYGPYNTNFVSYTVTRDGFSAGVSFEQGNSSILPGRVRNGQVIGANPVPGDRSNWGIDDYLPHMVAGAGYQTGPFHLRGLFAYDSRKDFLASYPGGLTALIRRGGWAAKMRADAGFGPVTTLAMLLYGQNSSAYTTWGKGDIGDETFSIIAGLDYQIAEAAKFQSQLQWVERNGAAGGDDWTAVGNVQYQVADGFYVRPELFYARLDGEDGVGGTIRFQRSW